MALDLLEMYNQFSDTLNDIDEKLDSRDPGSTGVKTKVINDWIAKTEPNWKKVSEDIVAQLSTSDKEIQIGFFYGLMRALDKNYRAEATKLVDEVVATTPKPAPLITEEEVPALIETRKDVYAKIKSIIDMANTFGDDSAEKMSPPRRRGGAPKGKRGPRAINLLSWSIDGVDFANLKEVVEVLPFYDKVKELTDAMKEKKIDTTNPPARIEFELPDGRVLVGINDNTDDDDDDDDDDNDEGDNGES